jgi:FkbH-like protein
MISFRTLKNNNKINTVGFLSKKMALLGDTSTQLFNIALKGWGIESNFNYDIFEADFNQIEFQILNSDSNFYRFNPEYTVIFYSSENLYYTFSKMDLENKKIFANSFIEKIVNITDTLTSKLNTKIIFINFCIFNDGIFGNFANKTEFSFLFQLRKINYELMVFAQNTLNFHICDFDLLQNRLGLDFRRKESTYINTNIITDINFIPYLTKEVHEIIKVNSGILKKCLILDLDNTLWGGIIGDDGIENIQIGDLGIGKAFTQIQLWAKQLKERGIILAICSKNNEEIAKEPFIKHPQMTIKLEDISVFRANWENKADNIRYIQSVLNIGLDSMVFVDDNPFERNLVKKELPQVVVPDLPTDPVEYYKYLTNLNLFETASFVEEDKTRTVKYQEEAKRVALKHAFTNEIEYLQNLGMKMNFQFLNDFNNPRIAQLSLRSNQFNLRTIRYSEQDLSRLKRDENYSVLAFELSDIYGDYGLISIVILKKMNQVFFIENWLMSCRVLNRGVEKFVLNKIVEIARHNNINKIIGQYIRTEKNSMVEKHYARLNFIEREDNYYELPLEKYEKFEFYIIENYE